jgi:predicted nucleic acid-binding protein
MGASGGLMFLVDTDVLIAHLRGVVAARNWLLRQRELEPLTISAVSVAELTGGMRSEERRAVNVLLSALRVEPVSEVIALQAGRFQREYRRNHSGISLGDYLIAGTAETLGYNLATLNVKHFPMFTHLEAPFAL